MSRLQRVLGPLLALASLAGAEPGPKPSQPSASCRHTIRGRSRRDGRLVETCACCGLVRVDRGPWRQRDSALELWA